MAEQVGSIEVEIKADPSKLKSGLASASKSLEQFGKRATSVGRSLSLSVTAPLLLAGRQALRASNEFEMSMGKIQGLVGVAGDEVAKMGEQAKQMATETGQSAQAAGEALFFITSAGLRGADAMSVLEQSLKASTAGLGEAKTVADLATSALNAYGPANITASQATDVLTKSVREGKLETDQLAGAMGRVLPISSAMGVQFHEVGAAFAALSRTGTDANEAATQLRGILGGILNPTGLAEKQLAALGSSSAELRKQIKEEGLLSTLNTLKDLFGNNTEAAAQVFGNVRALSGIMDLLGANVDTTRQIFESLNDTVGATDDAFNVIAETGAFKFEKAQKQLNNSMLTLGDSLKEALIPLVENFTKTITGLTESFNSLDEDTKKTIVQAGLLVAALGPVLMIIGQISIGLAALSGPIGVVVVALAGLTSAFLLFKKASQGGNASLMSLKGSLLSVKTAQTKLKDAQQDLNDITKDSSKYTKEQIENKKFEAKAALEVAKATLQEQKAKRQLIIDQLKQEIANGAQTAGFAGPLQILDFAFKKDKFDEFGNGLRKLYEEEKELERQTFALAEQMYDLDKALEGIDSPEVVVDDEDNKAVTDLTSSYLELIDAFDEWNQRASTAGYTAPKGIPSKIAVDPGMDIDALADQEFEGFDIAEPIDGSAEALERFKKKMENTAALAQSAASSISQAFSAMGQSLFGDLQQSDNAFQRFVGNIGSGIVEIIGMLLANAVSNAILSGTQAGVATGPAAPFTTPMFIATAVGAVMSAFSSIPAFAQGGMVTGPTLAMVGDNASGKEAIIPFEKMGAFMNMMGGSNVNVNITGEFDGDALRLVLDKSNKELNSIR